MTQNYIVQPRWNLCDVLHDEGINYSDYVIELVQLLCIKVEHENTASGLLKAHKLPDYEWLTPALPAKAFRGQLLLEDPFVDPVAELCSNLHGERPFAAATKTCRNSAMKTA